MKIQSPMGVTHSHMTVKLITVYSTVFEEWTVTTAWGHTEQENKNKRLHRCLLSEHRLHCGLNEGGALLSLAQPPGPTLQINVA